MTSDWKGMNKGVVNNVNKNKNPLIPPSPVLSRVQKKEGYASGM